MDCLVTTVHCHRSPSQPKTTIRTNAVNHSIFIEYYELYCQNYEIILYKSNILNNKLNIC